MSSATGLRAQQVESPQIPPTASAPLGCTPSTGGAQSVEKELCLGEQIPGFGGYDFAGPCEVTAYLTDLGEESAARRLLERHIKANSPKCSEQVSLDIRKGEYELVDLHRWRSQASELLLRDEETRIPGADDVVGPFIVDNHVTFFIDPESHTDSKETIAKAEQVLLTHGFDLKAFHLTSNPFLTRSLSWNLLGISDPCIPVHPPLSVCFHDQDVLAGSALGTSTNYLIGVELQSRPDLSYVVMISWDGASSLEEYANALMKEEDAEWSMLNPAAVSIEGYPAIRYDLEPVPSADLPFDRRDFNPNYQDPRLLLLIDTSAGIATIIGTPRKPEVSSEELYAGAKRIARILRVQHD